MGFFPTFTHKIEQKMDFVKNFFTKMKIFLGEKRL